MRVRTNSAPGKYGCSVEFMMGGCCPRVSLCLGRSRITKLERDKIRAMRSDEVAGCGFIAISRLLMLLAGTGISVSYLIGSSVNIHVVASTPRKIRFPR